MFALQNPLALAMGSISKDLMKEPNFDEKLVGLINEERKNRVYVTTEEDLKKYSNVNKAIKEGRFEFLQTNVEEDVTNKDSKNEYNAKSKNNLMKTFSKLLGKLKK